MNIYAVTFIATADGTESVSRYFDTGPAANRWAKWLHAQSYTRSVRIMLGGQGGTEVMVKFLTKGKQGEIA